LIRSGLYGIRIDAPWPDCDPSPLTRNCAQSVQCR